MESVTVMLPIAPHLTGGAASLVEVGQLRHTDEGVVLDPPAIPMVQQVVASLDRLPSQRGRTIELRSVTGYGAGLLAIRWGSLLALWLDQHRPRHPALAGTEASGSGRGGWNRIRDAEMARVNIESSAALAWLLVEGARRGKRAMATLFAKAIDYLLDPAVGETVDIGPQEPLLLLSLPELRAEATRRLREMPESDAGRTDVPTDALRRQVANLVVHHAWRTGAEAFHGGVTVPLGVAHARFTPEEAVRLEHRILDRMAAGTDLLGHGLGGRVGEMRLTLAIAEMPIFSVNGWSEVESGRAVEYPRSSFLHTAAGSGSSPTP